MPQSIGAPHRGDVFIISRGRGGSIVLHPPSVGPNDVAIAFRLLPDAVVTLVISKPVRKDRALKDLALKDIEVGVVCYHGDEFIKCVKRNSDGKLLPLTLLAGRGVKLHVGDVREELSRAA